ncbi:hypothetical protein C2845_PM17G03210 [Panicum miliaceum]|uniref:Uncharacterized protein n=1 Tax=Panicum miliaceum TaxID=4540 RepID=A0A3L6Q4K7_PANMI|nr:hypothetical protein C2845_PM17G03210 [Panicum miliaceum]
MAQSAVSSLLGQLSGLLVDEAKLLGGVRRDVVFIKDEMESMQGFLLDADGSGDAKTSNSNQVMAWRRQVREVAYDSQKCIDLYVQTVGASRPSAGLRGSVCWLPQLLRTMPARHRIAVEIKELKDRAREVGERRRRYGVKAPEGVGAAAGLLQLPQQRQEAEHARRRRAIADATDWINTDAKHVMNWIAPGSGESLLQEKHTTFMEKIPRIEHYTTENLISELIGLTGNRADATSFLKEHALQWAEWVQKDVRFLLKEVLKGMVSSSIEDGANAFKNKFREKLQGLFGDHGAKEEEPAPASAKEKPPAPAASQDDGDHHIISLRWLQGVLQSKSIKIVSGKKEGPRFLAIVTPPVIIKNQEDEAHRHDHRRGTEIARRVYEHYSSQGRPFDFTIWVNAESHSKPTAMLQDILDQVKEQPQNVGGKMINSTTTHTINDQVKEQAQKQQPMPPASSSSHDDVGGKTIGATTTTSTSTTTTIVAEDEVLRQEIKKHLTGKKYLIFLADHLQHDTSWTKILSALPTDSSDDQSSIILTPLVQQGYQYVGWFALSLFFLTKHSRYRVYFYSHLVATKKKAKELLPESKHQDLQGDIDNILTTCRWDSVSTNIFLHALHANPHPSKVGLGRLHLCLNEFSTVSNAINMIRFCYDDLPNHYKVCFMYLSIFPSDSKIRRTSLVRRWAAEGLVVGRDGLAATDEAERSFNELVDRGLLLPADNTENPSGKSFYHP